MKMTLWTIFVAILVTLAHEQDMARSIRRTGDTGYAGWSIKIVGQVVDK